MASQQTMPANPGSLAATFKPIWRLLPELRQHRKDVVLVIVTLILNRVSVAGVSVLGAAIASAVLAANGVTNVAIWLLVIAFVLAIGVGIFWLLDMWYAHVYSYKILAGLRMKLFDALDRANPSGLENRTTGEVAGAAMSDVEIAEWFYAHTILDLIATLLVAVIFTSIMVALVGPIGLLAFLAPLLILAIPITTLNSQTRLGDQVRLALAKQKGHCLETIQGSREIISLGLEKEQLAAVSASTIKVQKLKRSYAFRSGLEQSGTQLVISVLTIITLATLLQLAQMGQVSLVNVPPAMMLFTSSCIATQAVANMLRKLGEVSAAVSRYFDIIDLPRVVKDEGTLAAPQDEQLSISYENIVFGYTNDDLVLHGLNLEIAGGQSIALVGQTGAGKSTLAALTVRLREPQSGVIRLNGTDIRQIPLTQLRELITLVPQTPYLFRGTIRQNLLMAKPGASDEQLWDALRAAAIDDVISALPGGLDALLGERGATLSGGQRQRFSMAQAFLRNSKILIMDEAVSNLDPLLEQQLNRVTKQLAKGRTTIIIAHRLSTIKSAQQVAMIADGKVIAVGTHDQLLAECPSYRELVGAK